MALALTEAAVCVAVRSQRATGIGRLMVNIVEGIELKPCRSHGIKLLPVCLFVCLSAQVSVILTPNSVDLIHWQGKATHTVRSLWARSAISPKHCRYEVANNDRVLLNFNNDINRECKNNFITY